MGKRIRTIPRCRIFWLDGKKFRTNLLILFFDLPLRRETATKTALLAEVLKQGCAAYPSPQALARQSEALFDALWDISVVKKGDRQLLLCSIQTLKTIEAEEAVDFLRALLLQRNAFSEKIVARQKRILQERLESLADDKKAYARKRALEETAAHTPFALSGDGYLADLADITAQSLFSYAKSLLAHAPVRVLFCGDRQDLPKLLPLRQDFPGKLPRQKQERPFLATSQPHFLREQLESAQSQLVLGFSGDIATPARKAALLLLLHILGGDADSLLFQQLREEAGLCYAVQAYPLPLSPYLFIQAGIAAQDAPAACRLALDCIEKLRNPLPPARLRQAKEALLQKWTALADNPWAMADFCAEQILQNRPLSPDKFLRQLRRVDADALQKAAARLDCRAVYLLYPKESTKNQENPEYSKKEESHGTHHRG